MVKRLSKQEKVLQKAWSRLEKEERKLEQAAIHAKPAAWKAELQKKIPEKVYCGLQKAFCKGFSLLFQKGKLVVERSIDKENVLAEYRIREYAIREKGSWKEWKAMRRSVKNSDLVNLAVTTAEGIGLGALGIGMPDIVLFLGTLLRGIYKTSLSYGFPYDSRREQMLMLNMMAAALSRGQAWILRNGAVEERMALEEPNLSEEAFQKQLEETASVFAMDLLLLKFIQGLPVIGILGGAANPIYYRRVMKYVQMKYYKRYLRQAMERQGMAPCSTICDRADGRSKPMQSNPSSAV